MGADTGSSPNPGQSSQRRDAWRMRATLAVLQGWGYAAAKVGVVPESIAPQEETYPFVPGCGSTHSLGVNTTQPTRTIRVC